MLYRYTATYARTHGLRTVLQSSRIENGPESQQREYFLPTFDIYSTIYLVAKRMF